MLSRLYSRPKVIDTCFSCQFYFFFYFVVIAKHLCLSFHMHENTAFFCTLLMSITGFRHGRQSLDVNGDTICSTIHFKNRFASQFVLLQQKTETFAILNAVVE